MRKLLKFAIGGVAAAAIAGTATAAAHGTHVMAVPLSDGSLVRVQYVGDVAPRVVVVPESEFAAAPVGFRSMDGILEQMDRQMAAALQQIDALSRQSLSAAPGANLAAYGGAPAGTDSYSVVMISENGCSRTTESFGQGAGKPPKVVTHVSGTCATAPQPAPPAAPSRPAAPVVPDGPIHQS